MKHIITICNLLLLCFSLSTAQWTNRQNASQVIGQSDYTSYGSGSGSTQLNRPNDVIIDAANSKAYVVELLNYRVLRFAYPFTGTPPSAEMQFGTGSSTAARNAFMAPVSAAVYNNVLYVSDQNGSRFLRFNSASTKTTQPDADGIIGQTSYTSSTSGTSSTTLNSPNQIFIDGSGNLWVADQSNHRVLEFSNVNSKATDGTAAADLVLGQSSMITQTHDHTASTMDAPTGVCVKGTTVWVGDNMNYRVLRFDNPSINGADAIGVLGQTDLTSNTNTGTQSQSAFQYPNYVQADGNGNLYVTDANQVKIFLNAASKAAGANADYFLGQDAWDHMYNSRDQSGMGDAYGMAIDNTNNMLFVADHGNNRVLRFSASSALPVELTSFTAATNGSAVTLQWQTATEVNNYGFEVERRAVSNLTSPLSPPYQGGDRGGWQKIGFVQGAGTSNSPKEYSFTDSKSTSGRFVYRLKQADNNGMFKYSQSVEVEVGSVPKEFSLHQNYPNPFNPTTVISYQLPVTSNVLLKVYDMLGRDVATLVNETKEAGSYEVTLSAPQLASGVYLCRLTAGGYSKTIKISLVR